MNDSFINNDVLAFMIPMIPSQETIDKRYDTFIQVHEKEMSNKLGRFKEKNGNTKKPRNPPFWNLTLKQMDKEATIAKKRFL